MAAPYSAAGPRHMAFNDAGTYAYVIEQTTSTVDVFAVGQDGNLTYVNQTVTVLPEGLYLSIAAGALTSKDSRTNVQFHHRI